MDRYTSSLRNRIDVTAQSDEALAQWADSGAHDVDPLDLDSCDACGAILNPSEAASQPDGYAASRMCDHCRATEGVW